MNGKISSLSDAQCFLMEGSVDLFNNLLLRTFLYKGSEAVVPSAFFSQVIFMVQSSATLKIDCSYLIQVTGRICDIITDKWKDSQIDLNNLPVRPNEHI